MVRAEPVLSWYRFVLVLVVLYCIKKVHRKRKKNPRIIVGMFAHCPPISKWVPGGNTEEVKGGEERNWPPYLTMPAAQDKCPSNGHSPNVRNRIWDSPLPFYYTVVSLVLDLLATNCKEMSMGQQYYKYLSFISFGSRCGP